MSFELGARLTLLRAFDVTVRGNAFVAEHTHLDQLMRFEVDFDFLQHGIGQTLGSDEHDGPERMSLGAQVGALGGREFKSWRESLRAGMRNLGLD